MAAVTITPASGSITATQTVCKVNATGVSSNDSTAYNASLTPSEPELRYYFKLEASGKPTLKSHAFAASDAGLHEWNSVIFPASGSWTLTINNVSGDGVLATAGVTVS